MDGLKGNCVQFTAQGARSVFAISTKLWANKSRPAEKREGEIQALEGGIQPRVWHVYQLDFIGVKIIFACLCTQSHRLNCPILFSLLISLGKSNGDTCRGIY